MKNEKWSSLIFAVTYKDEIIRYVIEKAKEVYKPDKHNQTKCIELLLGAGIDVNATDERHNNALIYLATVGNTTQILRLINAGTDVNILDSFEPIIPIIKLLLILNYCKVGCV